MAVVVEGGPGEATTPCGRCHRAGKPQLGPFGLSGPGGLRPLAGSVWQAGFLSRSMSPETTTAPEPHRSCAVCRCIDGRGCQQAVRGCPVPRGSDRRGRAGALHRGRPSAAVAGPSSTALAGERGPAGVTNRRPTRLPHIAHPGARARDGEQLRDMPEAPLLRKDVRAAPGGVFAVRRGPDRSGGSPGGDVGLALRRPQRPVLAWRC